ncbi:hypothetical protein [Candidatus Vondammii sp. HM_W22]|uniref:hypothetical protein n=1 Tax=Candidatus Vondammii sp. HM_W22 TaxID=2687299 RepID=UPI002E7BF5C0|nr:hypothetical protein [Candidatus Vondammii sp. HM_W22]
MTELIRYDAMCTAIASCYQVDEVKDIRDKALAMEAYARQALNTDAERKATEIRIRAERKAGQMMSEMDKTKNPSGINQVKSHARPKPNEFKEAKESANISDTQAKRWQKLAAVPENDFEQALNTPAIASTTGIIKANGPRAEKPMNEDALWLWGRLRDFESKKIFSSDVSFLMNEFTESMWSDVRRNAESMITLCQEILSE